MFTLKNVPTCFHLDPSMQIDGHFFPAIVKAFEPGYYRTDWDYGADFTLAKKAVDSLNAEHGVNPEAAALIVVTSMFPEGRTTLDDIYAANGETVPLSVR